MEKIAFSQQMLKDLLKDTNRELAKAPGDFALLKLRACIYSLLSHYDEALADLKNMSQAVLNDASIHYLMSECYYQLQNYELAKRECLQANLIEAGESFNQADLELSKAPTVEELADLHKQITFEFNNTVAELLQKA